MVITLVLSNFFQYEYMREQPVYLQLSNNTIPDYPVSTHSVIVCLHLQLVLVFIVSVLHTIQPTFTPLYVAYSPSYLHFAGNTIINYVVVSGPSLLYMCHCPKYIIHNAITMASLVNATDLAYNVYIYFRSTVFHLPLFVANVKVLVRDYGIEQIIVAQWNRIRISRILAVYWIIRITCLAGYSFWYPTTDSSQLSVGSPGSPTQMTTQNAAMDLATYHYIMLSALWPTCDVTLTQVAQLNYWQNLLVISCDNFLSVISLGSVICYLCHYIGLLLSRYMKCDQENRLNLGTMCCTVFIILALQTGLTGLTLSKRFVRLHHNFCLLFTAVLHFVHTTLDDLILRLAASHNMTLSRHLRLLSLCFLLIAFPTMLIYWLWQYNSLSTWLLAVTAFSIEIIIKVIVTLVQYILFVIDSIRMQFWEQLDDYIYYIKSTGSTIEFLFGIVLFCNGLWVMFFESGSTIRAIMMGVHAYFNIWEEARNGWKTFMKRRTAVGKINSMPMASPEQLSDHNDVCAICYSELRSAHITRCNHLFHGVCLRKWLYINENCPMCHKAIYTTSPEAT